MLAHHSTGQKEPHRWLCQCCYLGFSNKLSNVLTTPQCLHVEWKPAYSWSTHTSAYWTGTNCLTKPHGPDPRAQKVVQLFFCTNGVSHYISAEQEKSLRCTRGLWRQRSDEWSTAGIKSLGRGAIPELLNKKEGATEEQWATLHHTPSVHLPLKSTFPAARLWSLITWETPYPYRKIHWGA